MTPEPRWAAQQRFAHDAHRPRYHFLPPANWMNDPNGLIQWQGTYHLFYQHNPGSAQWGDIHWGHAASDDLVHWRDLPIALAPTPGGPDEAGVFSGCAVNNAGVPTIIYTGTRGERHQFQTQCLATSQDGLLTWEKYPANPIIRDLPPIARQPRDFRDPYVWRGDDAWYMVLGSRIQDVGGAVFLYRSPNLIDWEYLEPLLINSTGPQTGIWECPNFFPLGDRWVLIVSSHTGTATGTVIYFVGRFENHHFTPETTGVLDYGQLYAPLTFADAQGRRLLFGWLREARSREEQVSAGWSGVQSIPRILTLDEQHRLCMTPVPELLALRGQHHAYPAGELGAETQLDAAGLAFDIEAVCTPHGASACGIALACSPDGQESISVIYDAPGKRLLVRQLSGSAAEIHEAPHLLAEGEPLQLRLLLDGSVLEILANERTSLTARFYPTQAASQHLRVFGSQATWDRLDVWEMPSIW